MARFSPSWFNIFKKDGTQAQAVAPADPNNTNSALLSLVRGRRKMAHNYVHEYEVLIAQVGAMFGVEMRSLVGYEWNGRFSGYGSPWSYQKTFSSFEAARRHANEILNDPKHYGENNIGGSWNYYWNQWDGSRTGQIVSTYQRPAGIDDGQLAAAIMLGDKPLPDDLAAGEVIRQLWGSTGVNARAAILQFARQSRFTYGFWSHWKWLYKQAEAKDDLEVLAVMLARLDSESLNPPTGSALSWTEQHPSRDTMAYMKRRARRYLRNLAKRNPALYVRLAGQLLKQLRSQIDLNLNWITLDILYGHSRRYIQSGHGRGGYVLHQKRLSLLTQDEQVPEEWSKRVDLLREFYITGDLPWQIQEWAYKMLRRRKIALPNLPIHLLWRFLNSSSPWLVQAAISQIVAQTRPYTGLAAESMARAFFLANGLQRRTLAERLATPVHGGEWGKGFARQLAQLIYESSSGSKFSARRIDAASLLARRYLDTLDFSSEATMIGLVPALIAAKRSEFQPLLQSVLAKVPTTGMPRLLSVCSTLSPAERQNLLNLLIAGLGEKRFGRDTARTLVLSQIEWVREAGWKLLAAARNLDTALVNELWDSVLARYSVTGALGSAASSPAALSLLLRSAEKLEALQTRFREHPTLLSYLTPDAFAVLARSFPLDITLKLLQLMDENLWGRLRERLVQELREDGRLNSFWRNAWTVISSDADGVLQKRLVEDREMAATFGEVCEASFLEMPFNPAFSGLLVEWMGCHPEIFGKGSRVLLTAAIHKAPEVREFALKRFDEVGLSLPFALRLLESGLPQSFAKGKEFFENVPPGKELDYALAICDSPDKNAQAYGREYLEKWHDRLPIAELTRRLAEHPDPLIQEIVARTLLNEPLLATGPEIAEFDATILRRRDKGRRVKEMVKQRLSQVPSSAFGVPRSEFQPETRNPKLETLIEMAQSRTRRDAEWAWEELTRLALAGQTIEGFQVQRVEGI